MTTTPMADSTASTPPAGAARGGINRRRDGANRRPVTPSAFKGSIKEMNGHVFQCHGESNEKNQFARTVEELNNYVGLNFKSHPNDIKRMIQNMGDTALLPPTDPTLPATQTELLIWTKEVDLFVKQREIYQTNKCALYSVVCI